LNISFHGIGLFVAAFAFHNSLSRPFLLLSGQAGALLYLSYKLVHLALKKFQFVPGQPGKCLLQLAFGDVPVSFGCQCVHVHIVSFWLHFSPARRHMGLILSRKERADHQTKKQCAENQAFQGEAAAFEGITTSADLQTANYSPQSLAGCIPRPQCLTV
jgi:hypothetical protein